MNTYFQPAIGVISYNSDKRAADIMANFATQRQVYLIASHHPYGFGQEVRANVFGNLHRYRMMDTIMKILAIVPLIAQILGTVRIVNALNAEDKAGPIELKREQILRGVAEIFQLAPILLVADVIFSFMPPITSREEMVQRGWLSS